MQDNFNASLAAVLKWEGGNDDDPVDRGGRTSRGITQREYDAWRDEKGLPRLDVWQAPQSDIERIYHDEYWEPLCDSLPVGIDYLYFDMAVNAGPYRATVLLQRALGVGDDGRIGPITRAAIKGANPTVLISDFTTAKENFYASIVRAHPEQRKFYRGWINRVQDAEKIASNMIMTIA